MANVVYVELVTDHGEIIGKMTVDTEKTIALRVGDEIQIDAGRKRDYQIVRRRWLVIRGVASHLQLVLADV